MADKYKIIGIKRTTFFNGKRRVGLDTNILIKLYDNPSLFSYEEARIFNNKDIIFVHPISLFEFIKYLKGKKLSEEVAKIEANNFLDSHNLEKVRCFIPDDEINKFEKECNEKFQQTAKDYLKCHRPDSIILLAFKKCNVNKVISTDESFRECANFLGIDGSGLPSLDYTISRELRRIFDNKRKYRKKK